jgi:hypothetical protein
MANATESQPIPSILLSGEFCILHLKLIALLKKKKNIAG